MCVWVEVSGRKEGVCAGMRGRGGREGGEGGMC